MTEKFKIVKILCGSPSVCNKYDTGIVCNSENEAKEVAFALTELYYTEKRFGFKDSVYSSFEAERIENEVRKFNISRPDLYETVNRVSNQRTRKRLIEIADLGLEEIRQGQFGIKETISGLYIETIWHCSDEEWENHIEWIKSRIYHKNAEDFKKKENFNWKKFENYVKTYDPKRLGLDDPNIIIEDMIYGIGLSIDEEKYQFKGGYEKFKDLLIKRWKK